MSLRRCVSCPSILFLLAASVFCGKAPSGSIAVSPADRPAAGPGRSGRIDAPTLLTKEEVSGIIGEPGTSLETNSPSHVTYKTANLYLEAGLEAERKRNTADALQAMAGTRTATKMLGGAPDTIPGLGDEAFFGAMSTLYLRTGDVVLTIMPPNWKQVAQAEAGRGLTSASDAESRKKAMDDLSAIMKDDPTLVGDSQRDPMKAAVDTVRGSSRPQGTAYEEKARAMARAMGSKALEKLGGAHV